MSRGAWVRRAVGVLPALTMALSVGAQDLSVSCTEGCADPGTNRSLNLLMRKDASSPLTIAWTTNSDPAVGGREVLLYAGNPATQDNIPARGALEFRQEAGAWRATRQFPPAELGRGTFLAVVTTREKGSGEDPWGKSEHILDWRAFRLLTVAEAEVRLQGPPPGSGWSITVAPALLSAKSGHGVLPRSQGGDQAVWWSFLGSEGNTADLDLDGEDSGIPGLGVQVSAPWHTSAGEDWKKSVLDHLTGVEGHTIRFDGIEWKEIPDRSVPFVDVGPVYLRHYYTAITLHTMASVKSFAKKEFRGGTPPLVKPTYFSHETSARLKHPPDPRLWASYSLREYGADRRLLAMLQDQVDREGTVPGLAGVQRDDGDGGNPSYTVGFYTEVRPWEDPQAPPARRRAGIVAVDVVAARAGVGGLSIRSSKGSGKLGELWCRLVRCNEAVQPLALQEPLDGYRVTSAVAGLGTMSGNLPLTTGEPEIAERGPTINMPTRARFGVTAGLRAGALMREGSFGHMKDMVPIDSYAQFIVKITVAMFPETVIVANNDVTIPTQVELSKELIVPPPPPSFWKRYRLLLSLAGVAGVLILVILFVPGGLGLIRSAFGVVVKALRIVLDGISSWLDRVFSKK